MKRMLATMLAGAMLLGAAGCSGGGASSSEGAGSGSSGSGAGSSAAAGSQKQADYHDVTAKIMIIGKNATDPFTNWLLTAAQNVVDEDYPNVEYVVTNLEDDPSNITTLLDQCILDEYDGVLIQKGSNSINSDAWYQAASAEGLKICAINAYANDGVASAS